MDNIQIQLNDKVFKSEFIAADKLSVEGNEYQIKLIRDLGNNVKTYSINNKIVTIQAEEKEDGNFRILYDNFEYEPQVKTETKAILQKFMKSTGSGSGDNVIKAPMPGLVVKIDTKIGEDVAKGDKLIIIEAMKMENALSTMISGKVKNIKVKEGDAVEKNTVLIELE